MFKDTLTLLSVCWGLFSVGEATPGQVRHPPLNEQALPEGDYMPGQLLITYDADEAMPATHAALRSEYRKVGAILARSYHLPAFKVVPLYASLFEHKEFADLPDCLKHPQLMRSFKVVFEDPGTEVLSWARRMRDPPPLENTGVVIRRVTVNAVGTIGPWSPNDLGEVAGKYSPIPRVTQALPNDPLFPPDEARSDPQERKGQWSLYNQVTDPRTEIDMADTWEMPSGSSSVTIAVIDTGVKYDHEDLVGRMWTGLGWDFIDTDSIFPDYPCDATVEDCSVPDDDPMDAYGHGTHVAGIIASSMNNGVGIAGVCPQCRIMALKAGYRGLTRVVFTEDDVAEAVAFAIAYHADIINMSFYFTTYREPELFAFYAPLVAAHAEGILLVASAGNWESDDPFYYPDNPPRLPAAIDEVIAVAGTDEYGGRFRSPVDENGDGVTDYFFESCFGSWVDLAAPGKDIISALLRSADPTIVNRYGGRTGTSMAAPHVAGVAGLIKSANPNLQGEAIRSMLINGAVPFCYNAPKVNCDGMLPAPDHYVGTGLLNARNSLKLAIVGDGVPVLSSVGLLTTALLLVCGGVIVLQRRRRETQPVANT